MKTPLQIAMFIRDEGRGTLLTDVREFCTNQAKYLRECVTSLKSSGPECVSPLDYMWFPVFLFLSRQMFEVPMNEWMNNLNGTAQ